MNMVETEDDRGGAVKHARRGIVGGETKTSVLGRAE